MSCCRYGVLTACAAAFALALQCHAQVVPVQVTGHISGSARVSDDERTDLKSFNTPVSILSPSQLSSFDISHIEQAQLNVNGSDHLAHQWSRVAGTSTSSSISGQSFTFAFHAGPASGAEREARGEANAVHRVQWSGGGYHLYGNVGSLYEPLVPPAQMYRYGHLRLRGPQGLIHEFYGFNAAQQSWGVFDVTGVLPPGEYEIEVVAMSRAVNGLTVNMDPMISMVTWTLEGATVCNDIDFNNDGLYPDASDIDDMLSVFAGGACPATSCDSIDFNNDGLFPDSEDLDAFLSVFSGGPCF